MPPFPSNTITCLACNGKGYIVQRDHRGLPYPVTCVACMGNGYQTVRS